jgi:hypothetical protein
MLKIITAIIDCSDTRRAELCFLTALPSANKNTTSLFWKLFSSVLDYQDGSIPSIIQQLYIPCFRAKISSSQRSDKNKE